MAKNEIIVTIEPDGEMSFNLDGFHGKGCSEVTEALVKASGGKKVKQTKKCEYYQQKTETKTQQRVKR